MPSLPKSGAINFGTVQEPGNSPVIESLDPASQTASSPVPQSLSGQMPTMPKSGAINFGTVQEPGMPSDPSLAAPANATGVSERDPGISTIQQDSAAGQGQRISPAQVVSGNPSIHDVTINDATELLDGPGSVDSSPVDPSAGLSNETFGPSQDQSGDVAPVQQPVNPIAPIVTASEMLLAATPAPAAGTLLPSSKDSAPIDAPTGVDVALARPAQAGIVPAVASKTAFKGDASSQPAPVALSHRMPAAPVAEQAAASSVVNNLPVNPTGKAEVSKRTDATGAVAASNHGTSLQTPGDNSFAASLSGTGVTGADSADAQGGDSSSDDSDHQKKDEALAGVTTTVTQAPLTQSAVALPSHDATVHQPVEVNPSVSGPSTAISGNTAANNSTKLTDLDPSTASDLKTVVSTSKLLQTLHQSEMRVGMRSTEFGDISIRAAATHDSILTQISVDHPELATSLAAHIPAMQARLEGHGNLEVHINTRDQSTGANSTMGDAGSGSQGGRQQDQNSRSYFSPSYSDSRFFDSALPTAALANTLQSARIDGRLDLQA